MMELVGNFDGQRAALPIAYFRATVIQLRVIQRLPQPIRASDQSGTTEVLENVRLPPTARRLSPLPRHLNDQFFTAYHHVKTDGHILPDSSIFRRKAGVKSGFNATREER